MEMQMQKIHFQNKNVWNNLERNLFSIYSVHVWNMKCFKICQKKSQNENWLINVLDVVKNASNMYFVYFENKNEKKRTRWS